MIMIIVFLAALAIGVPIAFTLGITGFVHMWLIDEPALFLMLSQRMFAAADNYSLLAIPLFILAGELLERSGDVDRLADLARSLVGTIKGGLAYVMVILGALLGGPLGSSNAEAALLGSTLYKRMIKEGYDDVFSACLVAAVSIMGPIIPPGVILVVYGVTAGISISELFFAGIMPGIYLAIAYGITVYIIGRKKNWPVTEWQGYGNIWHTFKRAFFSIVSSVSVLVCIVVGIATPTEAAALASVFIFLIGWLIYKNMSPKDLMPLCLKSGLLSGAIMLIVAMANILGWTLALDQIPQSLAAGILSISTDPLVVLLLLNVLFLVVGTFLETIASVIILIPVLAPLVVQLGIDPVHFGIIVCLNLTIGQIHPPVGVVLYTTSLACNVSVNRLFWPIFMWVGVAIAVLLLITYFPASTMFIPDLLFAD